MIVAGVVIETKPGMVESVRQFLENIEGISIEGDDGDRRIAITWTHKAGTNLEKRAEALIQSNEGIMGIFPTFVGEDTD